MTYFGDLQDSRNNNFDFFRFLMASLVIVCHSYAVLYGTKLGDDPLARLTHRQDNFGNFAVSSFFLISGYLIVRSWTYSKGWRDFAKKRALRILPGLIGVLLFSVFILGPIVTSNRAGYFNNPSTYKYVLLMFKKDMEDNDRLPGVFLYNPMTAQINVSLWTIRIEVICYILVAILGILGAYRKPSTVIAYSVVSYIGFILYLNKIIHISFIGKICQLGFAFSIGMLFYLYRDRIPYSGRLAILAGITICIFTGLHFLPLTMPILWGYILFYLAFNTNLRLQNFARHGDISYGIYLYAFPVQQTLYFYYPRQFVPMTLFVVAFLITCILATVSWCVVERPFLRLKPSR